MRNFFEQILHFFGLFLISLAIVVPIRFFIVQPFLVRGESMVPNFANFDYLFVERVSYYFRDPERGEPIVFRFPRNEQEYFIKRVIGVPGDHLIIRGGEVFIERESGEERRLDEFYLPSETKTQGNTDVQLGPDEYYVLGDNRDASFDSRRWGIVPKRDIVGRVILRIWPLKSVRLFLDEALEPIT